MSNVIKFPRSEERKALLKEQTEQNSMFMGAFSFTCPCGTVAHIQPQNMIFRTMEFYCKDCGTAHKVTNPAFTPPKPTKSR